MTGRSRTRIYVLERQPALRPVLETSLTSGEAAISGFSAHQECLERFTTKLCDLLVVDLEGCAPEGLDVIEQARRMAPWIPVVAIVEQAAVPCAIQAIKAGAHDCLEKPVQQDQLLAAIALHLARVDTSRRRRPRALTQMEIHILQMILAGRTSCEIAEVLHRSKRTIDVHRKNIMRKVQATNLVDLIKRALGMGLADQPPHSQDEDEQDEGWRQETPNGKYHIWHGLSRGVCGIGDPDPDPAEEASPRGDFGVGELDPDPAEEGSAESRDCEPDTQ